MEEKLIYIIVELLDMLEEEHMGLKIEAEEYIYDKYGFSLDEYVNSKVKEEVKKWQDDCEHQSQLKEKLTQCYRREK